MTRWLAPLLLLSGCQDAPVTFANVSVTLPEDTVQFPPGPGVEAVAENCAACHSPSMILTQPVFKPEHWKATIKKMREVYKAPIDPAAEPGILAYLESVSARVR